MSLIPSDEITHKRKLGIGYLFQWNGDTYRAVPADQTERVLDIVNSGLIDELVAQGLFVATSLTDLTTADSGLVLTHNLSKPLTLPPEWSFTMLQDAALTVLRVNRIARTMGYQTSSAKGLDVLFQHGAPVLFDVGGFVTISNDFNNKPGWQPYGEFMRSFYAPLKMWSKGESHFARHSLYGDQMSMVDYWRYRYPIARWIPASFLTKIEFVVYRYKAFNTIPEEELKRQASVGGAHAEFSAFVDRLVERNLLVMSSLDLTRLEKRVSRMNPPNTPSSWSHYHNDAPLTPRHAHIVDVVERYHMPTVLDMAGNAGLLSNAIARSDDVERVICADYDENAIDALYRQLRQQPSNVTPVLMDFTRSVGDSSLPDAVQRFRSDGVLALALTHHLLLRQGLTIDFILRRLGDFAEQYVVVEFMPLGLYSAQNGHRPILPDWYNLEWFRTEFVRHFTLLEETVLEENRVLLVGQRIT